MKIEELIAIADKAYPDGLIMACFKNPKKSLGDGLAKFIALELSDTFDPDASDEEQLEEAYLAMNKALFEVNSVLSAFQDAIRKPIEERKKKQQQAAEQAFAEADLPPVAGTGGWEIDGDYWSQVVFWENEDEGMPSIKGSFGVEFEAGSDKIVRRWYQ